MSFITVVLVRHGETDFNRQDLVQGSSDICLNDLGIQQSNLLGAHLANEKYTQVYSSDLKRAERTCEIILEHSNSPVPQIKLDPDLREKDFGVYEGQPNKEMHNAAKESRGSVMQFHPPGGESHKETMDRVMTFFEKLCKISDEADAESKENILVVSHGMLIMTLLMHLHSKKNEYKVENFDPMELFRLRRPSPNTGKTILRIYKLENPGGETARRIEVLCFANGSHLDC